MPEGYEGKWREPRDRNFSKISSSVKSDFQPCSKDGLIEFLVGEFQLEGALLAG
jgi:hypothetical protein